jgi:hypothetical protein
VALQEDLVDWPANHGAEDGAADDDDGDDANSDDGKSKEGSDASSVLVRPVLHASCSYSKLV